MANEQMLYAIAALTDCIRAMQRGDELRAKEKLAEADKLVMKVAEELPKDQLAKLF